MNTLQRLWNSVQSFGYPLRSNNKLGNTNKSKSVGRNNYRHAMIEQMEERLLMTTLTVGGQSTDQYVDSAGKSFTVTISNSQTGVGTVELIFVNSAGKLCDYEDFYDSANASAGLDLFAVIVTSSDINTVVTIDGVYYGTDNKLTGGFGGTGPTLWQGVTNDPILPVTPDNPATGTVYIGGRIQGTTIKNEPFITASALDAGLEASSAAAIQKARTLLYSMSSTYTSSLYTAGVYVLPDAGNNPQDVGRILIDGTVTGNVYMSGSIDTFYCGWLLTGDAVKGYRGDSYFRDDNFYVAGDIKNLWVKTSVGTDIASNIPVDDVGNYYYTQVDVHVGGQVGNIKIGGAFWGSLTVDNSASAPDMPLTSIWGNDVGGWTTLGNTLGDYTGVFRSGYLPFAYSAFATLSNNNNTNPIYVGTLSSGNTQVISGQLNNIPTSTNKLDSYAVGLIAGQTITLKTTFTNSTALEPFTWGIIDSEGRVVALASGSRSITFKAKEAGVYRIVIAMPKDVNLNGSVNGPVSVDYSVEITGLGSLAIGGFTTGGDLLINGQHNYANDAASVNPDGETLGGIVAARGGIGAISAGGDIISNLFYHTMVIGNKAATLYDSGGSPGISIINGSLNSITANAFGRIISDFEDHGVSIKVNGKVGSIRATSSSGLMYVLVVASDDIQLIDGEGNVGGFYATKKSIGVIRAGEMTLGTLMTQFWADYDDSGRDGFIDLIDVKGDFGSLGYGGPRISTGTGGNVRFINIGASSTVYQDIEFTLNATSNRGGIDYYGGETISPITDDSGSKIYINPINPTVNPNQIVVTIWSYICYGTSGSVIIRIESNYSLNISTDSGSNNTAQSAEIGQIVLNGPSVALIDGTNGSLVNPKLASNTGNTLNISGSFRFDVFMISSSTVINSIRNQTDGDIVNINAGQIGSIYVDGSIGLTTKKSTANELNQIDILADTFPFYKQHNGIKVGSIGSLLAGKAIGAVICAGTIGTIQADYLRIDDPDVVDGILAPVYAGGNIGYMDIGATLAGTGLGIYPEGGVYVVGTLFTLEGTNADIRADIISSTKIGTVHLTNGSIIDAYIGVFTDIDMGWTFSGPRSVTEKTFDTTANPVYEIDRIWIEGKGGIIGSWIATADIGFIEVSEQGFGIVNTDIMTLGDGVVGGITAGGLGLVDVSITAYRLGYVRLTGKGNAIDIVNDYFDTRVTLSDNYIENPYTGQQIADENPSSFRGKVIGGLSTYAYSDLKIFWNDYVSPFTGMTFAQYFATYSRNPVAGMLLGCDFGLTDFYASSGSYSGLYAYDIDASEIRVGQTFDKLQVTTDVNYTYIQAAKYNNVSIGKDFNSSGLYITGSIGALTINGNFTADSTIHAKGASASGGTITVLGDFLGTLVAAGTINTLNVGTAPTKNAAGHGNFSGNIILMGTTAADTINFYGNIDTNGKLTIDGNVTKVINISRDLAGKLTITGNVQGITVGTDTLSGANGMTGSITINGNLDSLSINGAMSAAAMLDVTGNLGTFTLNGGIGDTALLAGDVYVGGGIGTITLNGNSTTAAGGSLTGYVQATKGIGTITVNNGDIATTAVIKSLFAGIAKISVNNGIIDGTIIAGASDLVTPPTAAVISEISIANTAAKTKATPRTSGSIGVNAVIRGASLTKLTVANDIKSGADLIFTGAIGTATISGSIEDDVVITASKLTNLFKVGGDMNGDILLKEASASNKISIAGNFGANDGSTDATITVAGSLALDIAGAMDRTSTLRVGRNLASLTVKKNSDGNILVNGTITTLSAASMTGAVVTAGADIGTLKVTGEVISTLVQAGITFDYATGHFTGASSVTSMGNIGTMTFGKLTTSVIAAGGSIKSLSVIGVGKTLDGIMDGSSASSGLVFDADKIDDVFDGTNVFTAAANLQTLRTGGTLYRGNFENVKVFDGKADGLLNGSALTAGISAGANGIFETTDTTDAPGTSTFGTVNAKPKPDAVPANVSVILSETASTKASVNGAFGTNTGTHTVTNPVGTSELTPTSIKGNTYTYTINGQIITVTVSAGYTAKLYDDASTSGVIESLIISGTGKSGASVVVKADNPDNLKLGQVLAGDDVNVATFTFNGDIVGLTGEPSVQIDSAMTTFSVRSLKSDVESTIGGDVGTLTIGGIDSNRLPIGGLDDGQLTIRGAVKTLKIYASNAAYSTLNDYGIVANSFGTVTLGLATGTSPFTGRIKALLGGTTASINTVSVLGTGIFEGAIGAVGSVGTITVEKADYDGRLIVGGDVKGLTLKVGKLGLGSNVSVGGTLTMLSAKGDLTGSIGAVSAGSITIGGAMASGSSVSVTNEIATLKVGGSLTGTVSAAAITTEFTVTGVIISTSNIHIAGDVAKLNFAGGTETGSYVLVEGSITTMSVGATHSGTIATAVGGNLDNATFTNVDGGLLVIAGDIKSLTATGTVKNSLFSAGVYIGADGKYNNNDDRVYGGSIKTATFKGDYIASVVSAGVLPKIRLSGGNPVTGLPDDRRDYVGLANASDVADSDAAQTGGITRSVIDKITFSKFLTDVSPSKKAVVVAADGINKTSFTGSLTTRVVGNSNIQVNAVSATVVDTNKIELVFDQPIDSSTLNSTTIKVTDNAGVAYPGLTYTYSVKAPSDDSRDNDYVVTITTSGTFTGTSLLPDKVVVTGGTSGNVVMSHIGSRSARLDLNQDGTADYQPVASGTVLVGFPHP